MQESKQASQGDSKSEKSGEKNLKAKANKSGKPFSTSKGESTKSNQEVLLKLPGGFEYKMPGKKQRIIVASLVVGLNMLLLVAVGLYFYVPGFKDFIYHLGR